jgi:hypothetical protein
MALNKTQLQSDILTWMNTTRTSQSVAGQDFETIYHNYILGAVDISGDSVASVITNSIKNAFIGLTLQETTSTAAAKIETGFISYWIGASFNIAIPAAGISVETSALVTTPPIAGSLAPALTTIFSNLTLSNSDRASQISTAIDTMTKTIIVTCVGPSVVFPFPVIMVPGAIS